MKRDRIVQELRRRILSGDLPRGTHIRQDELARDFETSITPVREALRLLEAEGLLTSAAHRGVRVAGIDPAAVRANFIVRKLVETYAMQRAVRRLAPIDFAALRRLLAEAAEALAEGNAASFHELNHAFHFYFYERCGLPELSEHIASLWQAAPWNLVLTDTNHLASSHRDHLEIVDAFERGDVDRVTALTQAHTSAGYEAIARGLHPDEASTHRFRLDID